MVKRLGALIDCSRNCVYTVDALKKFIDILADIGYDYLQLYTEDTFDIGDPRFGYLRGRYNVAEIKELDGYASARGIELIPFIQTLGISKALRAGGRIPIFAIQAIFCSRAKKRHMRL